MKKRTVLIIFGLLEFINSFYLHVFRDNPIWAEFSMAIFVLTILMVIIIPNKILDEKFILFEIT